MLVLHGGPGIDQEPLVPALAALQRHRTLVFFDQLGCGRTPATTEPVTAEATFAHAAALVDALGPEPLGIVAYSWGCVVAGAIAMRRPDLTFAEALMINPIGLSKADYAEAQAAILGRIPEETVKRMWDMLGAGASGTEAFAQISPFYLARETEPPRTSVVAAVYASVEATIDEFDFWPAIERMGRIIVVRGTHDFVPPSSIRPLLDRATADIVLPAVGHFAFFEDPQAFAIAIDRAFANATA